MICECKENVYMFWLLANCCSLQGSIDILVVLTRVGRLVCDLLLWAQVEPAQEQVVNTCEFNYTFDLVIVSKP